jgi:RimJ/RimL family protein N-acetyltransferase
VVANNHADKYNYTLWAACLKQTGELIGYTGLNYVEWQAHFTPAVEIGWRLSSQQWNKGYATESAKASLQFGFNQCALKKIVSFTVPANKRSIRVMDKIGMKRDIDGDFAHPKLPLNHPLSKHLLYCLDSDSYAKNSLGIKNDL